MELFGKATPCPTQLNTLPWKYLESICGLDYSTMNMIFDTGKLNIIIIIFVYTKMLY